jgi:hypothetical protein
MSEFNKPTNPPAFPNPHLRGDSGITMRDYFAARAMRGVIAATPTLIKIDEQNLANWSYKMADSMLKAREQ